MRKKFFDVMKRWVTYGLESNGLNIFLRIREIVKQGLIQGCDTRSIFVRVQPILASLSSSSTSEI